MNARLNKTIEQRLRFIYKENISSQIIDHFIRTVAAENIMEGESAEKWTEQDAILITYGDSIVSTREKPLQTLKSFLDEHLKESTSYVHILPFFPYSSDDGFSVINFTEVNPELGNWDHIRELQEHFGLMADLVVNHISQQSNWFKQFLLNKKPGREYFISPEPDTDLSMVVRPRSTPLLTPFLTTEGKKYVWTTFSEDQIDLNYANPELLLEMIKVLLFYAQQGIRIIRLDAIAFLWKKIGTNCLHLPETHEVVKLMRDILEHCYPSTIIITETNVPHKENISYFGNGDEAHMVYNFTLPPLLLHCLHTGNSGYLVEWAKSLDHPGDGRTYFNFTASHDGIGVRPLEGILPDEERNLLIENMKNFGGYLSSKSNSDGTNSPYEINITYFDAMKGNRYGEDQWQVDRFLCSQTIAMAFMGIPAIYIHSFTATRNYQEGVNETGRYRTINRKKWDKKELLELLNKETDTKFVFDELKRRLAIRKTIKAFHPSTNQEIIKTKSTLFALKRIMVNGNGLLSVSNISDQAEQVSANEWNITGKNDLLSGATIAERFNLAPYQTIWVEI
ncbi:MAG: alpha-amylase [Bacteroidetes bacterium]|jgi:sucrose phosphorylase|nr:alpha-amylase [Bacteroidota bacterium]